MLSIDTHIIEFFLQVKRCQSSKVMIVKPIIGPERIKCLAFYTACCGFIIVLQY